MVETLQGAWECKRMPLVWKERENPVEKYHLLYFSEFLRIYKLGGAQQMGCREPKSIFPQYCGITWYYYSSKELVFALLSLLQMQGGHGSQKVEMGNVTLLPTQYRRIFLRGSNRRNNL